MPARRPSPHDWLTVLDCAEIARVDKVTVRHWISKGLLPAYNSPTGRTVRVKRSDLDAVLTPIPTVRAR